MRQLSLNIDSNKQENVCDAPPIKTLNLYAGIGGNRCKWENVDVTAVEMDAEIAAIYQSRFPKDTVIVGDAHAYLLQHYMYFDFIWTSPPCPSHSRIRKMGVNTGMYPAIYPDIKLWEEITLLKHFAKCKWVVENVLMYYSPIVPPTIQLDRHLFWTNFYVPKKEFIGRCITHKKINGANSVIYGVDLSGYHIKNKRTLLRNMVDPDIGNYLLMCAKKG